VTPPDSAHFLAEVELARRAGDYGTALAAARQAKALLSADDDLAFAVEVLRQTARAEEQLGDYSAAEATLREAIERAGGDPGPAAVARAQLASVVRWQGHPEEAEALADEAVELAQLAVTSGEPAHGTLLDALVEQAYVRQDRGNHAAAEHLLAHAQALARSAKHSVERSATLNVSIAVARTHRVLGRYNEAFTALTAIRPDVAAEFGQRSLELAELLNDIGICCKFSGRFDEGQRVYLEALTITEEAAGPDHPDVASIYHNLGGLAHARRDFQAAIGYGRRSVEVRARCLGPDHLLVAADQVALAAILHDNGNQDEAEGLLLAALAIYERIYGPSHYEIGVIRSNLGAIALARGDLDQAASQHSAALQLKESNLGPDHPEVAISLNNLGVVRRLQGRNGEAAGLYRRAVTVLEGKVEPDHPTLATARRNLARLEERP
jgi:tetratricopeptide (TPR) repeat protein